MQALQLQLSLFWDELLNIRQGKKRHKSEASKNHIASVKYILMNIKVSYVSYNVFLEYFNVFNVYQE